MADRLMMAESSAFANVLKHDRTVVLAGLAGITALSWAYIFYLARKMSGINLGMDPVQPWDAVNFLLMFLMWAVMMVAMMLPSVAPMVLLFSNVNRQRRARAAPYVPTSVFTSGYLVVWTAFSLAATLAQWALNATTLLSPMMASSTPVLGGLLLVAAGVYQWTSHKETCLVHCRTPFSFIMAHWREGWRGAFAMGLHHGAYCVGCCWALMALLFVYGVMNLMWIAALAAFVLVEKLAPPKWQLARVTGALLMAWGGVFIASGFAGS